MTKSRRKTNWTPEQQREFSNHVWRHNAALGQARHSRSCINGISVLQSATEETKQAADQIVALIDDLIQKLAQRVDPPYIL